MSVIESIRAIEILDSRGRPTVKTTCWLRSGAVASASVPSGASTGSAEALELRDGEPNRYGGLGCRRAVANVNEALNVALRHREIASQGDLDRAMTELDGTANKSRLGANAILSVSIAFARACAVERGVPLYRQFADLLDAPSLSPVPRGEGRGEGRETPIGALRNSPTNASNPSPQPSPRSTGEREKELPRLTVNLFSGGKHAGGQVAIQDVLVVPMSAQSIDESLAQVYAIYQAAAKLCLTKYNARPLTADEGGLAPPFPSIEAMLDDAVESIRAAGFEPGRDVALAVDLASSHFYNDGKYQLGRSQFSANQMIDQLRTWIDRYPIASIEDGLAEDDWENWPRLRERIGQRALVLGDDLLCTNPARVRKAIDTRAANALLLKVNQVGTLTEAAEALQLARSAGWSVTVSARSGETEDNWLADLAVGWSGNQIKVGSITQSERLAKYNRLLEIEAETGWPLAAWRIEK